MCIRDRTGPLPAPGNKAEDRRIFGVKVDEALAEAGGRGGAVGTAGAAGALDGPAEGLAPLFGHHLVHQGLLVLEVEVKGALGHTGGPGDLADAGLGHPLLQKKGGGRLLDAGALLVPRDLCHSHRHPSPRPKILYR